MQMNTEQTTEQMTTPTTQTPPAPDWATIRKGLAAPFPPEQVGWRIQGKPNAQGKAQVVCYIDARDLQNRLDEVVGPEGWSFTWEPIAVANAELKVAKGTLTIFGVSKSDVGDASTFDGTKGTVSDCFKRAAVMWGVARYLYDVPSPWVAVDGNKIPDATLQQLQDALRRRLLKAS